MATATPQTQAAVSTATADAKESKKEVKDSKNRLYLKWEITNDMIKAVFGKHGKVADARVVRGHCFGFVSFETEADAAKALAALNGKDLASQLAVEVASSERTARRRERKPRAAPTERKEKKESKEEKKDDAKRQPRRRRERPARDGGEKNTTEGADAKGTRKQRRRRARRVYNPNYESKDPNFGKIVKLVPDPTKTDLPTEAKLVDVRCGNRTFRGSTNIKPISTLVLKADPKKGPFKCDFKLDQFDLKLLQVKVTTKNNDTRVACRVAYPTAQEVGDAYMRSIGTEIRSRNFALKRPNTQDDIAYFLGIDRILMDPVSGLWKELTLSLCTAQLPKEEKKAETKA
jgi:hypothetical protein